jgi:hypothetical protein
MLHIPLIIAFTIPMIIAIPLCWISYGVAMLLGGAYPEGGLAGAFAGFGGYLSRLVDTMQKTTAAHKPVAYSFNGAVSYWRKQLAVARDVDSKGFERLADFKRYAIKSLPKNFDYGSKSRNTFHKHFRFANYIIGKRPADKW